MRSVLSDASRRGHFAAPVLPAVVMLAALLSGCGDQPKEQQAAAEAGGALPSAGGPRWAMRLDGPGAASAGSSSDELDTLRRQVQQLQSEVAAIRQSMDRANSSPRTLAAATAPDPRRDPAARQEADRVEKARVTMLDSGFRSEPYDARWSQGASAAVNVAFSRMPDASAGRALRSVECRSQSCRVELDGELSASPRFDLSELLTSLGAAFPNATAGKVESADGRPAMVLYLSR